MVFDKKAAYFLEINQGSIGRYAARKLNMAGNFIWTLCGIAPAVVILVLI